MNRKLVLILILLSGLHFFNYGKDKMNMKNYIYDGFSWIIDQKLSGMPFPGVFDPEDDDIRFLQDKGITLLVSLTLKTPDKDLLKKGGIRSSHYPVKDFHAPTVEQLNQFCLQQLRLPFLNLYFLDNMLTHDQVCEDQQL